jgi:TonB family protein
MKTRMLVASGLDIQTWEMTNPYSPLLPSFSTVPYLPQNQSAFRPCGASFRGIRSPFIVFPQPVQPLLSTPTLEPLWPARNRWFTRRLDDRVKSHNKGKGLMRAPSLIAFAAILPVIVAAGQQDHPGAAAAESPADPQTVKVYPPGPGVTPPERLHSDSSVLVDNECTQGLENDLSLLVVIDAQGTPHIGSNLVGGAKWENRILRADRFKPAVFENQPVTVAELALIHIDICTRNANDSHGDRPPRPSLRAAPIQEFSSFPEPITEATLNPDGSIQKFSTSSTRDIYLVSPNQITAPVPVDYPPAEYPDSARRARVEGVCLLSLVVDPQGKPQDLHVLRSPDPALSASALKAASAYRFKPATREGRPVSVLITLESSFRFR